MSSRKGLCMFGLLIVVYLCVCTLGDNAVLAKSPKPEAESAGEPVNTVRSISVQKGSDSLAIDVNADGPCVFKHYAFQSPSRLVVDIIGAANAVRKASIPVDHLAVRAVRVGQFKLKDPMITRVVVDLEERPELARAFRVESQDRRLRISLDKAHLDRGEPDAYHRAERKVSAQRAKPAPPPAPPVDEIVLPAKGAAEVGLRAQDREEASQTPAAENSSDRKPVNAADTTTGADQLTVAIDPTSNVPVVTKYKSALPVPTGDSREAATTDTAPKATSVTQLWSLSADRKPAAESAPLLASGGAPSVAPKADEPAPKPEPGTRLKVPTEALTKELGKNPPGGRPLAAISKAAAVGAADNAPARAPVSEIPAAASPAPPAVAESKKPPSTPETTAASPVKETSDTKTNNGTLEPAATTTLAPPTPLPLPETNPAVIANAKPDTINPASVEAVQKPASPAPSAGPVPVATLLPVRPLLAAKADPSPKPANGGEPQAGNQATAEIPSRYTGEPISLDFKDGDLVDFFRLLSQITGLNIVLDPSIKGSISLKMTNVPYDQVFDVVLENNDLEKRIEGNVVRVARKETLRKEEEERRKLKEAQALASDTFTETVKLNYASADALSKILTKHLSPKGEIVVDQRTNTLIVKDIPDPLLNIKKLVYSVDTAQPQVEIEARIVSASRDFARDIGVQLGFVEGNLQRSTVGGPNTFGTIGGTRPSASPGDKTYGAGDKFTGRGQPEGQVTSAGVGTGIGSSTPGNYMVNLPAQAPNRFFGLGYSLGNIFDKFLLDASITAGEARGLAKLISQPKVTVQNNTKANITQGIRFPVQVIQNNTVTVQFFDAALRLTVQPQITDAGTILLELQVENNVADFARQVGGIPSIRTSESKTKVLVGDGGTTVIAGILIDNENRVEQKAPGIANLPLVGNLFKRRFNERNTQEILFFITPRIRKEGF